MVGIFQSNHVLLEGDFGSSVGEDKKLGLGNSVWSSPLLLGEGLINMLEKVNWGRNPGADPGIYFGGGQTKVPNRKLKAKPESRARSARVSRAKPESRARSARELRAKPEPRAKPEKKRGEGSGEGARWAPPQKIFEKSNLKPFILVHIWSNYLKWLTKWFNCPLSWKIISNYLMWRNY